MRISRNGDVMLPLINMSYEKQVIIIRILPIYDSFSDLDDSLGNYLDISTVTLIIV